MNTPSDFNELIEKSLPFTIFRLPNENNFNLVFPDSESEEIKFSFTSFDNNKKYFLSGKKIIFDCDEVNFENLSKLNLSVLENKQSVSKDGYIKLLNQTINFLKQRKASKIVISREKNQIIEKEINLFESVKNLAKKYPKSFCYLTYWNPEEVWLGATPEVLVSIEDNKLYTMALAGTLPDVESAKWGEKEKKEQQIVADYIYGTLEKYSENIKSDGQNTLHLGTVKHLITNFYSELKQEANNPEIISKLHPTPAVCGIPLEISREFILENEKYDRDFYAGYISIINQKSEKHFVNLRCAKIYKNAVKAFVGGGITADSTAESEWEETEIKSEFILKNLK